MRHDVPGDYVPLSQRLNPRRRDGALGRAVAVGLALLWMLAVLAAMLAGLAGCRAPAEVVTVTLPPPPPSVVTHTDTLLVTAAPDTLFAPPDTVRVTETVPVEVVRYAEPRPDTSRAYRLWHLAVDSARVVVSGQGEDLRMAAPAPGERLVCIARSSSRLECRVEGEPAARTLTAECPACPEPEPCRYLVSRTWRGYLLAISFGLACLVVGVVAGVVVRSFLPR